MAIPKLIILLGCSCITFASHGSYNIPIEGYESELQVLGQHVEIPETPVKVIKITKTIAVKIPVPYPVKVREKVPYPVHIAKPYPVPVPQIVKVPAAHLVPHKGAHEAIDINQLHQDIHRHGNTYQVQENNHSNGQGSDGQSYEPIQESYDGYGGPVSHYEIANDDYSHERPVNKYDAPSSYSGGHYDDGTAHGASESKSYDQDIQSFLASVANKAHGNNFGYH